MWFRIESQSKSCACGGVAAWNLSPEDALLRQEALTVLREAVDRLPEPYRAVVALADIEGPPHQEIATLLDLTVPTVKTRLHRARLSLREALADYFGERRAEGQRTGREGGLAPRSREVEHFQRNGQKVA